MMEVEKFENSEITLQVKTGCTDNKGQHPYFGIRNIMLTKLKQFRIVEFILSLFFSKEKNGY